MSWWTVPCMFIYMIVCLFQGQDDKSKMKQLQEDSMQIQVWKLMAHDVAVL